MTAMPTSRTGIPEQDEIRGALLRHVLTDGRFEGRGRYDGGGVPGMCWKNAWGAARAARTEYWEGAVRIEGVWRVHAWTRDYLTVIEVTPGYPKADLYAGWRIDQDAPLLRESGWSAENVGGVLETFTALAMRTSNIHLPARVALPRIVRAVAWHG